MTRVLKVAVPGPFRAPLDYLPPEPHSSAEREPAIGCRVKVPLGRRQVVGVVVGTGTRSAGPEIRLRAALALLDPTPLLDGELLALAQWASDYYHHPLGDVLARFLPPRHRRTEANAQQAARAWQLTARGHAAEPTSLAERAPAQAHALERLQTHGRAATNATLRRLGVRADVMRRLAQAGLVERITEPAPTDPADLPSTAVGHQLNAEQAGAVVAIEAGMDSFGIFLLDGVTGSGKTEVYLHAMSTALAAGRQVLMLVPEIGLTPQAEQRLHQRFGDAVTTLHSGMADGARLRSWERCRVGHARVLVGTRSAVFTPMPDLGLIVVDEEHDESYKQQEGLRYSARDLALIRARNRAVPAVLGSATPSLESLHNAHTGRYRHLRLPSRAGGASQPRLELVDLRRHPLEDGLSTPVASAIAATLAAGNQALVFLNRRGFAPTLRCSDCGWVAECRRCDARMTVHSRPGGLRCHHCGARQPLPSVCPQCGAPEPLPIGQGTQRSEAVLARRFPGTPVLRIDRDTTAGQQALHTVLDQVEAGEPALLVGTQMLAKGHHFPAVTLVAVLDADGGLFSADFRASERVAQQILQVAGRAGRAERPGQVLIQTQEPQHPLWQPLLAQDYGAFASAALDERRETGLPPFAHLALLRADAPKRASVWGFLDRCAEVLAQPNSEVAVLGPVSALRERLGGHYRAQLLLQSPTRAPLHRVLRQGLEAIEGLTEARRVRWSLDVDPSDLY